MLRNGLQAARVTSCPLLASGLFPNLPWPPVFPQTLSCSLLTPPPQPPGKFRLCAWLTKEALGAPAAPPSCLALLPFTSPSSLNFDLLQSVMPALASWPCPLPDNSYPRPSALAELLLPPGIFWIRVGALDLAPGSAVNLVLLFPM